MEYLRPVKLLQGKVPAPFSMGRTKRSRCTVLPDRCYTPEEISLIFRHELHHLQRLDVDTKVFLCLCRTLCWFNPLVWMATRKAADDLELSCDEIIIEGMSKSERKTYAKLLLDAAAPEKGCTTCLSAVAGTLRYRLKGIMGGSRRRRGIVLLMVACFLGVMCRGVISFSDMRGSFSSLILMQDVKIHGIKDEHFTHMEWDDTELKQVLDGIELEHVVGFRDPGSFGEYLSFELSGHKMAYLNDHVLAIQELHSTDPEYDCYLVADGFDWDALRGSLRERMSNGDT